jgi:hypothetical protein
MGCLRHLLSCLVSGPVVAAFAGLGDLFKPKSFAGLFGAAWCFCTVSTATGRSFPTSDFNVKLRACKFPLKAVNLMSMTRESVDLIAAILAAGVLAATGINIIQEQDAVDRVDQDSK